VKRVAATAGVVVAWFVVVAAGVLLGGHNEKTGISIFVIALVLGPILGIVLLMSATEEAGAFPAVPIWIAWCVAGILGGITMLGAAEAYEWSYGRPQAVIVMDTQCLPDPEDQGCAAEVRVSTVDMERDLGWLRDCGSRHGPGERAVVLTDPRGWFRPQLPSCAEDGRWVSPVIVVSVGFAAALSLTHLAWAIAFEARERRRVRRWRAGVTSPADASG
jgi:hypothetical protein